MTAQEPVHLGFLSLPAEVQEDIAELAALHNKRERLGRLVRDVWITWAREQPDVAEHPSWLVGWDDLSERDREVDRRIGTAVAKAVESEALRQALGEIVAKRRTGLPEPVGMDDTSLPMTRAGLALAEDIVTALIVDYRDGRR